MCEQLETEVVEYPAVVVDSVEALDRDIEGRSEGNVVGPCVRDEVGDDAVGIGCCRERVQQVMGGVISAGAAQGVAAAWRVPPGQLAIE